MATAKDSRYDHTYLPPKTNSHRRKRRPSSANAVFGLISLVLVIIVAALCWETSEAVFSTIFRPGDTGSSESDASCPEVPGNAPVLHGVRDLTVYCGDTVSYRNGITATSETGSTPSITVDSSMVDLSSPGKYQVIYTATDAYGNQAQASAEVTVLKKEEGFVDLETIYAAADAKLHKIIRKNASVKQQVHDIYAWARLNLHYGGHSDRTDWRQTAYVMLTEGTGDCYGFYAVTKLLFERLNIPNIDVCKVRNFSGDTDHFWSLVSVDGGISWYHFDATPRVGNDDTFCLVTDSFLDAYSQNHDGSHNRDKSLYPPTP